MKACMEMVHSKSLPLAGWEDGGRKEERWKARALGCISLREHIERKKYSYSLL